MKWKRDGLALGLSIREASRGDGPTVKRVVGIVLIVIGVPVCLLPFRERIMGTALEQSRSAFRRGDWHASLQAAEIWLRNHPRDIESRRIKAHNLARLGRGSEAIAVLSDFSGDHLTPADLQLLSDELIKEDRQVLGLAALTAATKLIPRIVNCQRLSRRSLRRSRLRLPSPG